MTIVNAEGDRLTPSVVLFDGEEVVVGKEALKALATEADHVAECSKRDIGRPLYHKSIGGEQYPPEVIEAFVLAKLCGDAARQIGPFSRAVITVPAYFDETRRKATQDAGYIAGLEVLDIINEPTAAAVAFGFQRGYLDPRGSSLAPQHILVYDLGGGTFDVTVMQIRGTEFNALATDGDVRLGGYDWDLRLVDLVAERFAAEHGLDPRGDPLAAGKLRLACEDAKRTLSARQKAAVTCDCRGTTARIEIARQQFEQATADLLDRTRFTTVQALRAAGLDWSELDRVLLVGGSTRMPMVREMLRQLSGKEPDDSVAADEAVAHGAALHAWLILGRQQGQPPRFKIRNVNSHSLGVVGTDPKTQRRRNGILIPRNTPLPITSKRVFHTKKAGQRSIGVDIVEGESRLAGRLLADRPLRDPRSAGRPAGPLARRNPFLLRAQWPAGRARGPARRRREAATEIVRIGGMGKENSTGGARRFPACHRRRSPATRMGIRARRGARRAGMPNLPLRFADLA